MLDGKTLREAAARECTESAEVIARQMAWGMPMEPGVSNEDYEEALLIEIIRALARSQEDADCELIETFAARMLRKIGIHRYRNYTIDVWNGGQVRVHAGPRPRAGQPRKSRNEHDQ